MNLFVNRLLELQYQYSKLFTIGIPRRKFVYEITESKFSASNTSRNTIFSIAFTAAASFLLLSGIIEIYKNPANMNTEFAIVFFGIHPFVGILGLRQLLWLVNGTEKIIIEGDFVTLEKNGTFWTKSHSYKLSAIDFIRQSHWESLSLYDKLQFNTRLNALLIFKMAIGEIHFNYHMKDVKFFSNLLEDQKKLVVEQFKKIKELSQHNG